MIEYDFEGYARSKIDKGLGYLEGFSKGYHQAKSEWVGLTDEDVQEVERWIDFKEAGSDRVPTGKLARYIENKLRVANGFE